MASALALFVGGTVFAATSAWAQRDSGTSVEAGEGEVELGVWIEVAMPGAEQPDRNSDGSPQPCHLERGNIYSLLRWLGVDLYYFSFHVPGNSEQYIFNVCRINGRVELVSYWIHRPAQPSPPTTDETTQLRNEAWGQMAIPEPTLLMAPSKVTIVQIPTFVWVSAADRAPVSETVTTTLDGHELTLTATAYPRRLGFLRVDMGDGNTLWCDADDVVAFDHSRDPLDQPSNCFHYYRQSSVNAPDLRYQVALTAYWEVSVSCTFNGGPCTNPPPAVPTQVLTAPTHPIAVAEIQALARPG